MCVKQKTKKPANDWYDMSYNYPHSEKEPRTFVWEAYVVKGVVRGIGDYCI